MHHATDTDGSDTGQCNLVLFANVRQQIRNGILQTAPDIIQCVRPDAIFQTVFPAMAAGCHRGIRVIDQNGFDTGGTELDAKNPLAVGEILFCRL